MNKTGPPSSSLMASEISAISGDSETRALAATKKSNSRFTASAVLVGNAIIRNSLLVNRKSEVGGQRVSREQGASRNGGRSLWLIADGYRFDKSEIRNPQSEILHRFAPSSRLPA